MQFRRQSLHRSRCCHSCFSRNNFVKVRRRVCAVNRPKPTACPHFATTTAMVPLRVPHQSTRAESVTGRNTDPWEISAAADHWSIAALVQEGKGVIVRAPFLLPNCRIETPAPVPLRRGPRLILGLPGASKKCESAVRMRYGAVPRDPLRCMRRALALQNYGFLNHRFGGVWG
jgi:hypothetical protein